MSATTALTKEGEEVDDDTSMGATGCHRDRIVGNNNNIPLLPPPPFVVACGQRRIAIAKTGNTFPAVCICLSSPVEPSQSPPYLVWRSKRDFLLLARSSSVPPQPKFPKAAYQKLTMEEDGEDGGASQVVPWLRPMEDIRGAATAAAAAADSREAIAYLDAVLPQMVDSFAETKTNGYCHPYYFLFSKTLPNHYQAKMKKSVWQLDTFLQAVAQQACLNEEADDNSCSETNNNSDKLIVAAWRHFCRPHDTDRLVPYDAGASTDDGPTKLLDNVDISSSGNHNNDLSTTTQATHTTAATTTNIQDSCRLGQYFASTENSARVAELAVQFACNTKLNAGHYSHHGSTTRIRFLFVEPSCGRGDIVVALLQRLMAQNSVISAQDITIVGYDLDPHAVYICQQRPEFTSSPFQLCWRHGNFLESQWESFWQQSPPSSSSSTIIANEEYDITICLGGPPYTTGAGRSSDIQRDLPTRFVHHCQVEWKADFIAFLLPERYRHNTVIAVVDGCRNNTATTDEWLCETQDLASSTFYFQGTQKVTQPSILQTYHRRASIKIAS